MPTLHFSRCLRRWWERSSDANRQTRAPRPCALRVEALEDRSVPATALSVADASVVEPAANGTVNLDFTVTRTGDLTSQITVGFTTVAGTAQPGTNFTPTTGIATFAPGSATATISIPVFGDGAFDYSDLSFSVQLTGLPNVTGSAVTFAAQETFSVVSTPQSVAVGDLNSDGKSDLVLANSGLNSVSVLLNTTASGATTPSFAAQQTFATGSFPFSVVLGDVNSDGRLDLVLANQNSSSVSVLLNATASGATTPSFATQQTFAVGNTPWDVALGDVNGDGRPDLAVANETDNTVSVLLNTTAPGATTPSFDTQQTFATGTAPYSVGSDDINGDGRPDLVVANQGSDSVSVLLNTTAPGATTPSFDTQQTFATGTGPVSVTAGDVDGDGKADLVVSNNGSNSVSVLLNTTTPGAGTSSFAAQQTFATGTNPYSVALGDVNDDGKPDLAVANLSSDNASVLLSAPVTITRGTATGTIVESPDVVLNGTDGDDELLIERTPGGDVGSITFTLNGAPTALTGVTSFTFNGLGGDDTLTASKRNGGPLVPGDIRFDGGTGANTLIIDADGASTQSVTGVVTFGDPQDVAYANVAAINVNNAATVGAFAAPNTADRAAAFVGLSAQERYVQALYLADLGRAGSRSELAPWVTLLATPNGTWTVADAIGHSPEARDRLVRSWYVGFLDRPARNNEHAGFVAALLAGASEADVLSFVLGSPEFYARAQQLIPSGTADERYVRALYQVLLNRSPGAAEVSGQVRGVPAVGPALLARVFLSSVEFRAYQIEGFYNALLHRPADPAGRDAWASSGLDLAAVLVGIQSHAEFFANG